MLYYVRSFILVYYFPSRPKKCELGIIYPFWTVLMWRTLTLITKYSGSDLILRDLTIGSLAEELKESMFHHIYFFLLSLRQQMMWISSPTESHLTYIISYMGFYPFLFLFNLSYLCIVLLMGEQRSLDWTMIDVNSILNFN
ncbi:hypothetical protein E2542_SST22410 [Spatholobus suberectus]|nr:hypothetical protein E2542_SST22410 [Spatholobus suberectus]